MSLVSSLCSDLGVGPELLARIVDLPTDRIVRWSVGGVPPHHHSDFRPLEELLEMVREWSSMPVRSGIRIALPALDGGSILQALEEHGAFWVLERLRVDVRLSPASAAPAEIRPSETSPPSLARSVA